jgi:hypothetical protein
MRRILSAGRRRTAALAALPALALVAWVIAPLATGSRTLVLRDVLNTHLVLRAGPAESLRALELPLVDPLRGGGQPALGNANAVLYYPDNLLLLAGSTLWQLNAHFWLHWLAAFAAMYWLARRWGASEPGAVGAAAVYGFSGYLLSQLNLFNAIAAAALSPALAAALLAAGGAWARRRRAAAAGLVWALLLLGGDPLLAGLGLVFALAVALARHGRRALGWPVLGALAAGTLVAAPQWVETARIWGESYRGFLGGAPGGGVRGLETLVELAVPLFFGSPARGWTWAQAHFGGFPPLYFALYPGFVAWLLAARAGTPRRREARVAAALAVAGAALAYLGSGVTGDALRQLSGGALRYPDKLLLWPALALPLAAGLGLDRVLRGERARRVRVAAMAVVVALTAAGFVWSIDSAPGRALAAAFSRAAAAPRVAALEHTRWAVGALAGAATLAVAMALARRGRARPARVATALVTLHAATQLALLAPLRLTDEAARYCTPPPLAAQLPPAAVLAHGGYDGLFGAAGPARPTAGAAGYLELARTGHAELYGGSGRLAGHRWELDPSPEGLSHFTLHAVVEWMRRAGDRERVALAAAAGVERLLLPRPLAGEALAGARLVAETPGEGAARPLWIYELEPTLPPAGLAGEVVPAPHLGAAMTALTAPGFDPRRTAVVAGGGAVRRGPPGSVELQRDERERVELVASSEAGGVLVLRRAYLPIWRATIDGRPATPTIAQATRLALALPPGRHEVRLWISRRPLAWALAASLGGGVALLALAAWPARRSSA